MSASKKIYLADTGLVVTVSDVTVTSTCVVRCKFCQSKNVVKNGVRSGNIQYYICRACGRGFAGNNGWLVNYNYFRPHESLRNQTPAMAAKSNYPYKNWKDVVMQNSLRVEGCK